MQMNDKERMNLYDRLLITANANVTVNHNLFLYTIV